MAVKKKAVKPSRLDLTKMKRNGKAIDDTKSVAVIDVPQMQPCQMSIRIVGDRPLMVNNKMSIAPLVAEKYDKGRAANVKLDRLTPEEQYAMAFYVLPDSKYPAPHPKARYGIPASGIKKCFNSGTNPAGINNNTDIGRLRKGFHVLAESGESGGLCLIQHNGFHEDIRPVNIGSGQKTVPSMRRRPMFNDWWIDLKINYNPRVITPSSIFNLAMYAGQYIGLCEMRAEKAQGECGGFTVEADPNQLVDE